MRDISLSFKNATLDIKKVFVYSPATSRSQRAGRDVHRDHITELTGAAQGSGRQRGSRDKERAT
jgi:hypothetical protein